MVGWGEIEIKAKSAQLKLELGLSLAKNKLMFAIVIKSSLDLHSGFIDCHWKYFRTELLTGTVPVNNLIDRDHRNWLSSKRLTPPQEA